MKIEKDGKVFVTTVINFVLAIVRYLALAMCVIYGALTFGFLIVLVFKSGAANETVYNIMNSLTNLSEVKVLELINSNGLINVAVAGLGYGFVLSFTSLVLYLLVCRYQTLAKGIQTNDCFDKKCISAIDSALPLSVIYALSQPVVVCIISFSTGIFDLSDASVGGFAVLIFTAILKFIYDSGSQQSKIAKKYDKLKNDLVAKDEETNLEILNKEAQIKELKDTIKELKDEIKIKEEAKKVVVSESTKVEEKKKNTNKRKFYRKPQKKVSK